jgi:hypothetical protein
MTNQTPMQFGQFPGPFNMQSGTTIPADFLGSEYLDGTNAAAGTVPTADGEGNITFQMGGDSNISLPTVTNGVVFATDTAGDLSTNSNFQFTDASGLNLYSSNFTVDSSGDVTVQGNMGGTAWEIVGSNGSAVFAGENTVLNADGSAGFANGNIALNSDGSAAFSNNRIHLNYDGSVSFASDAFVVDSSGNATVNGNLGNGAWEITAAGAFNTNSSSATINANGSATFAANNFSIDANGNAAAASLTLPSPSGELKILTFGQTTFESSGSVAVADTSITSSSIIIVTAFQGSATVETYSVSISSGTGFTIYSSNPSSTADVNYIRIN